MGATGAGLDSAMEIVAGSKLHNVWGESRLASQATRAIY